MSAARDILNDDDPPVSLKVAARQTGLSVRTIQTDIGKGAPVARRGGPGRGNGALIRVGEYMAWRNSGVLNAAELRRRVGDGLLIALRADCGLGYPAHVGRRRVSESDAAALYLVAYERVLMSILGVGPDAIPDEVPLSIEKLHLIAETRS